MFLTRLISGIVLLALAILTISLNGPVLFVTLLVVSLIGMLELYRAVGIRRKRENILTIVCYAGATAYYILMYAGMSSYYLAAIALVMTAILFVYVFSFPKYHAEDIMAAFFGVVYVAVCLSFIFQTRNLPDGQWLVWLIFLCSWGCDTMAYCTGRLQHHKMQYLHLSIQLLQVGHTHSYLRYTYASLAERYTCDRSAPCRRS